MQHNISLDNIKVLRFYAPWCGPCNYFKPHFERAVDSLGVPYESINTDDNKPIAAQYGVTSIPTTVILKDNEVKATLKGVVRSTEIMNAIREAATV